jgi:hypothetical protein
MEDDGRLKWGVLAVAEGSSSTKLLLEVLVPYIVFSEDAVGLLLEGVEETEENALGFALFPFDNTLESELAGDKSQGEETVLPGWGIDPQDDPTADLVCTASGLFAVGPQ